AAVAASVYAMDYAGVSIFGINQTNPLAVDSTLNQTDTSISQAQQAQQNYDLALNNNTLHQEKFSNIPSAVQQRAERMAIKEQTVRGKVAFADAAAEGRDRAEIKAAKEQHRQQSRTVFEEMKAKTEERANANNDNSYFSSFANLIGGTCGVLFKGVNAIFDNFKVACRVMAFGVACYAAVKLYQFVTSPEFILAAKIVTCVTACAMAGALVGTTCAAGLLAVTALESSVAANTIASLYIVSCAAIGAKIGYDHITGNTMEHLGELATAVAKSVDADPYVNSL
ncbi:MAG: hypothetical protein AAF153_03530, partial [Pseudomonadota bacterium]